jgi:type II secretory pathway component PulC
MWAKKVNERYPCLVLYNNTLGKQHVNQQPLPIKSFGFATQSIMLLSVIVLVGIACAGITYKKLSTPTLNQSQKTITASEDLVNTGSSIREIVTMNMFGAANSEVKAVTNYQDIPETNLKLSLKGAFSNSDPKQASALIASDKGTRAELYFIESELPNNATLKEVHPSYVVLSRGGRLEKLLFFRSQGLTDLDQNTNYSSSPALLPDTSYSSSPASLPDTRDRKHIQIR